MIIFLPGLDYNYSLHSIPKKKSLPHSDQYTQDYLRSIYLQMRKHMSEFPENPSFYHTRSCELGRLIRLLWCLAYMSSLSAVKADGWTVKAGVTVPKRKEVWLHEPIGAHLWHKSNSIDDTCVHLQNLFPVENLIYQGTNQNF